MVSHGTVLRQYVAQVDYFNFEVGGAGAMLSLMGVSVRTKS